MEPKKRGIKIEGQCVEVIENTCRKNVRFRVCVDVYENK
jgi:hypothetical protein